MGADGTHTTPSLLPSDRPRGREALSARAAVTHRMSPALTVRIAERAASIDATPAAPLVAAVLALVSRLIRDDVVTISLTARALSALVGRDTGMSDPHHLYTVSVETTSEQTLADLNDCLSLAVSRAAVSRATRNAAGIVIDVGAPGDTPESAEVCIALQHRNGEMLLTIDADASRFDASTLGRWAECLTRLVDGAVSTPTATLKRIDIVGDEMRTVMLGLWNETAVLRSGPQLMHRLIEAQVAATPARTAVEFGGRTLTYRALNDCANVLALQLVAHGVGAGAFVGICVERSLDLVVALLAIHKTGAAFLPIDPDLPRERVRFMLEDSSTAMVLAHASTLDRVRVLTAGLPMVLRVVGGESDAAGSCVSDRAKDASTTESAAWPQTPDLPDRASADDLAYLMYTSGSTGRPKGVLVSHRALCNHAQWFATALEMTAADRMLQHASISFDAALVELFAPLVSGGTVVLAAPHAHRDVLALPALLQRERISVVQLVPSALRVVASTQEFARCTALRFLVSGGEVLDGQLASMVRDQLPDVRLGNFYGPTEAAVDATSFEIVAPLDPRAAAPIGKPIANARCRILDPLLGLVPVGMPGELYVGGIGLARGYLNLPERTATSFVDDPYATGERLYRTGDLVRYLPDGNIEYIGRIDTQVKLRGYRIELAEVEGPLLQHPEILEAAVVLRDDSAGESQLAAYVVPRAGAHLSMTALRDTMRSQLPAYMVPASFSVLNALPLMSNGKLDRRALIAHEPTVEERETVAAPVLLDPLERSLQAIWERTLGVHPIGPDDDFFVLGGHSLKAIRVLSEIEHEHGIALRAPTLFDAPNIRALAARMRDERLREISTVIPVQARGTRPPLFVAPGGGGELFVFDALARALGHDQPLYVLDMYVFDEVGGVSPTLTLGDVAARMVADIRRVQPVGPYQLGGYSLGGNIVYEIAQQLHRSGQEVRLLALLDCDGPSYPHMQPFVVRAAKHLRHALSLGRGSTMSYLGARFGKLSRYVMTPEEEKLKLYADQDEAQLVPAHIIEELEKSLTPVLQAWERYVPRFYDGPVLIVRAEVRNMMIGVIDDDPFLGWGPFIGGGVQLERIDCSHFDILRPEFSGELTAILQKYLATHTPAASDDPIAVDSPSAALTV